MLPEEGANSGKSEDSTVYTWGKKRQMEKLGWIREAVTVRCIEIEYARVQEVLV